MAGMVTLAVEDAISLAAAFTTTALVARIARRTADRLKFINPSSLKRQLTPVRHLFEVARSADNKAAPAVQRFVSFAERTARTHSDFGVHAPRHEAGTLR